MRAKRSEESPLSTAIIQQAHLKDQLTQVAQPLREKRHPFSLQDLRAQVLPPSFRSLKK